MKYTFLLLCLAITIGTVGQTRKDSLYRYQRTVQGVTLPQNAEWYNARRPFTVFDISERILIAHVWNPFTVDGVASIDYMNQVQEQYPAFIVATLIPDSLLEGYGDKIAIHLIKKHKINHPVLISNDLKSLKRIKKATPSIHIIREDGEAGPVAYGDEIRSAIETYLPEYAKASNLLNHVKNQFISTESLSSMRTAVNYPADMVVSDREQRAYIADPSNNRIMVLDYDGQCNEVFGSGVKGFRDARGGAAQFNHPIGLALDEGKRELYVADAFNHAIRKIDLQTKEVTTLLGNGERAEGMQKWVDSTAAPINFPTDVCVGRGKLMITMTGHDQLWEYDFKTQRGRAASGNGQQGNANGERGNASYNEPYSIARDEVGNYFVLDRGSSSLRKLDTAWVVSTIDLKDIELSQPSGLCVEGDKLYISDTGNHRIVEWDLRKEKSRVLSGTGDAGLENQKGKKAKFNYPTGLDMLGGDLWVADTHNQSVRKVQPKKGKTRSLEVTNSKRLFRNIEAFNEGDQVYLEEELLSDGNNSFYIELELPSNLEWVDDGRNEAFMERSSFNRLIASSPDKGYLEFECRGNEMNPYAGVELYLTVRDKNTGVVIFRPVLLVIPFIYEPDASRQHNLKWAPFAKDATLLTPFPWQ